MESTTEERPKSVYQPQSSFWKFKPTVALQLLLLLHAVMLANYYYPFLRFDYELLNCGFVIGAFLVSIYLFFNSLASREFWKEFIIIFVLTIPQGIFGIGALCAFAQSLAIITDSAYKPEVIRTIELNGSRINVTRYYQGGCFMGYVYQIRQERNILPGLSIVKMHYESYHNISYKVDIQDRLLNQDTVEFSIKATYPNSNDFPISDSLTITPKPFVYF